MSLTRSARPSALISLPSSALVVVSCANFTARSCRCCATVETCALWAPATSASRSWRSPVELAALTVGSGAAGFVSAGFGAALTLGVALTFGRMGRQRRRLRRPVRARRVLLGRARRREVGVRALADQVAHGLVADLVVVLGIEVEDRDRARRR